MGHRRRPLLVAIYIVVLALLGSAAFASSQPRLRDVTREANLEHRKARGTWGSAWADFDADGDVDVFEGRHGAAPLLYLNEDGRFRRSGYDFVNPPGYRHMDGDTHVDRHVCAWGEATGDGRPDLYCGVGANEGGGVGPNQLLLFSATGVRERARRYGLSDPYGRARSVNWFDYDGDGDLDLYVGNWQRSSHPSSFFLNKRGRFERVKVGLENQLRMQASSWSDWDRDGDPDVVSTQYESPTVTYELKGRRFASVSIPPITGGNWRSVAWGDFNGDGWTDVHLMNETRAVVARNNRGRGFRIVDSRSVKEGRMSQWLDLENDGDLDLFVVQGAPGRYPNRDAVNRPDFVLVRRDGRFVRVRRWAFRGPRRGNGDTVATADHARDGRSDVFVTNGYFEYEQWAGKHVLFENRTPAGNWIGLTLRAGPWNPLGIGARVRVTARSLVYWRELTDGVAFRSQSEVGHATLGIGARSNAAIRIIWSDGSKDCAHSPANAEITIRKGRHPCPHRG